jgi:hypothetical protein
MLDARLPRTTDYGPRTLWSFTTILIVLNFQLAKKQVYKLEDTMTIVLERYSTATVRELLDPLQSTPFAPGFSLANETIRHSESKSPELASTWEERDNNKSGNGDDDLELRQLMEDIKRYIRSIDISNL